MKKDNAKKAPKAAEGRQVAAEDITLPDGRKVRVRVVDCRQAGGPGAPEAKRGTPEFAAELEYLEALEELRAKVALLNAQMLLDVIGMDALAALKELVVPSFGAARGEKPARKPARKPAKSPAAKRKGA